MNNRRCYFSIMMTRGLVVLSLFFLFGCKEGKVRFLVCPHKYAGLVEEKSQIAARREILFTADEFSYLIVKRNSDGTVIPVQHYRSKHTSSHEVLPLKVSWEAPLHISTIAIIDSIPEIGIAIKIDNEKDWRVKWLSKRLSNEVLGNGVLFLPPYNELALLSTSLM